MAQHELIELALEDTLARTARHGCPLRLAAALRHPVLAGGAPIRSGLLLGIAHTSQTAA